MLTFVTTFHEGGLVKPEKFYFESMSTGVSAIFPKAGEKQDDVLPSNFAGSALTLFRNEVARDPIVFRELIVVLILLIHRKKARRELVDYYIFGSAKT
jgi:hypothetical protein